MSYTGGAVKCLQCEKIIEHPRTARDVVIQKFCNRKCRTAWHNRPKNRAQIKAFLRELQELLRKYRLTE